MAHLPLLALVAEQLRLAIERRGLTQARAAELLQTSQKHLNQVLQGRARPSVATLEEWSERLGIEWQVEAVDSPQPK